MPQETAPVRSTHDSAVGLGLTDAALSTSSADDAELQGFIAILREPFNIGDWNNRDPQLVLFLRSIHLINEDDKAPDGASPSSNFSGQPTRFDRRCQVRLIKASNNSFSVDVI